MFRIKLALLWASLLCILAAAGHAQVTTIVQDDFNGSAGAYSNNTYWTYNWPGQAPDTGPTLDGNGSLVIPGGGGAFGSGVSGFQSTINKISADDTSNTVVTFEASLTVPANTRFYFGRTDFGSWGNPAKVAKWGPGDNGNLEIDSWYNAAEDTGIAYPVDTPFSLRFKLISPPSGPKLTKYEYNFGSGWQEYTPGNTAFKSFDPGPYVPILMNDGTNDVKVHSFLLTKEPFVGPTPTTTPSPTPSPTPSAANILYEDLFTGAANSGPRSDLWTYNSGNPKLDGNGNLVMVEGGGPFGSQISGLNSQVNRLPANDLSTTGGKTITWELRLKAPANSSIWFGKTDFGSWGNEDIVSEFGLDAGGNLVLDSWQGSDLEDTGIAYPVDTFFSLRIQFIGTEGSSTAQVKFFYNFGSGWVEYVPQNAAFRSFNATAGVTPLIMNQNGSGAGVLTLDHFKVFVGDPDNPNATPTPVATGTGTPNAINQSWHLYE